MKQTLTVRAIIKQDQKLLLLRRSNGNPAYQGLFELPGGKVDFGEDPRAAIQREVAEEIGREIETLQLNNVYSILEGGDAQQQYITLVFWASLKAGENITLDVDHDKYVWKALSEIQLDAVTEETQVALKMEETVGATDVKAIKITKGVVNKTTIADELLIYADGGSRGNPGPSSSGFVVKDMQDKVLFEGGKYLGITTNNQAEYQAVKLGLDKAYEMKAKRVEFRLDSLLVVNQLNGVYKIRNRDLWPIHAYIKEMSHKFQKVVFKHVRREFNKEADAMVNKILDQHM